jgi:hypothetical protein
MAFRREIRERQMLFSIAWRSADVRLSGQRKVGAALRLAARRTRDTSHSIPACVLCEKLAVRLTAAQAPASLLIARFMRATRLFRHRPFARRR